MVQTLQPCEMHYFRNSWNVTHSLAHTPTKRPIGVDDAIDVRFEIIFLFFFGSLLSSIADDAAGGC